MAEKTVICDTDVIIDYWNINSQRHLQTKQILEDEIGLENVTISAITQIELIVGAKDREGLNRINKKIKHYTVALIDNDITTQAITLLQNYRLSYGLAFPDAFIDATCKVLNVELFTHNTKDYKFIDGLVLYEPK